MRLGASEATVRDTQVVLKGVEGSGSADDAFASFVRAHQAELVRLGWALTGERQLGEDLAQSALQRLWPHWPRVAQRGEPLAYTQRIMVTLSVTWRRRRWHGERLDAAPPEQVGDDTSADVDEHDAVEGWLDRLPARQRAVIVLRFLLDLDVNATADRLGCSAGTVKSQTAKALRTLRAGQPAEETTS